RLRPRRVAGLRQDDPRARLHPGADAPRRRGPEPDLHAGPDLRDAEGHDLAFRPLPPRGPGGGLGARDRGGVRLGHQPHRMAGKARPAAAGASARDPARDRRRASAGTDPMSREALARAFLHRAGWGDAERGRLAGDASFRHYERLRLGSRSAVLMDAPPPQEDVRPFLAVDRILRDLSLSAPEVLAEDVANGFLLLEDFGDGTYTRLLADGEDERGLYAHAVDVLIHLHRTFRGAA